MAGTFAKIAVVAVSLMIAPAAQREPPTWERANPITPLPEPPLGIETTFSDMPEPPTPARVRLGRWLFFDKRLSADGTIACGTCHRPEHGFSEPTPVSTGIRGQKGGRKAPPIVNPAWPVLPHFFWDGRAGSLEEQALGPVANPTEMGNTHDAMVTTLRELGAYAEYFDEAFGTPEITKERVAKAIADYERVAAMSGNSPWDRWRHRGDEGAVSAEVKRGNELFFGKAACSQCHLGQNFSDSLFHNLGIGWRPETKTFSDDGRYVVTKQENDRGAFKTPTLRDVALHAPYMHDGSVKTLREAVELYNNGGIANPNLDQRIKPLHLTADEIDALVTFMEALTGQAPRETPPGAFPGIR